jgi:hypothetical protein
MAEEIVPLKTRMKLVNKETGEETFQDVVATVTTATARARPANPSLA